MMACTSPTRTSRSTPWSISLPPAVTRRSLTESRIGASVLPALLANASLQIYSQQLLRFDSELHGEFPNDLSREPIDDHRYGVFRGDAALLAVENLILADLRCS